MSDAKPKTQQQQQDTGFVSPLPGSDSFLDPVTHRLCLSVLDTINASPHSTVDALQACFPQLSPSTLTSCLGALMDSGVIVGDTTPACDTGVGLLSNQSHCASGGLTLASQAFSGAW